MLGFGENSSSTFGNSTTNIFGLQKSIATQTSFSGIFGNNSNATPFRGSFTFGNKISGNNEGTQIKFEVAFKFMKNLIKNEFVGNFNFSRQNFTSKFRP